MPAGPCRVYAPRVDPDINAAYPDQPPDRQSPASAYWDANLLSGLLAATRPRLTPEGDDELTNHGISRSRLHLPLRWAAAGNALRVVADPLTFVVSALTWAASIEVVYGGPGRRR